MTREEAHTLLEIIASCITDELSADTIKFDFNKYRPSVRNKVNDSTPSTDRPSGEWTYLHGSIGSYMTISCPFCGTTFNDVAEWQYNYCPSCGARMKGGDIE